MCSNMWGPCIITSMLKVHTISHFSAFYTVMIHVLQCMNFGSGVTFYKDQAIVKSGYNPTCMFCKINCYYLKADFEEYLHLANSVITVHHSQLRVLSLEGP